MSEARDTGCPTTIGLVGAGNMGTALAKGWLREERGRVDLLVWDKMEAALERLPVSVRLKIAASLDDLAARADVVLLVVKPKDAGEVFTAIAGELGAGRIVISSMAGVTIEAMRTALGPGPVLFRIMPNLGVELGVGAIALAAEPGAAQSDSALVMGLLRPLGHVEVVPEELLDVVTAVSGSGPAFLAVAMEGLEDGGVMTGLSRAAARKMVQDAALDIAEELPRHEGSPGGLRESLMAGGEIEGAVLDVAWDGGVRSAFERAVEAALERSRRLRGG